MSFNKIFPQVLEDGTEAGLVCEHDCQGNENCLMSCYEKPSEGVDFHDSHLAKLRSDYDIHKELGVSSATTIVYGMFSGCPQELNVTNHTTLYPAWQCDDAVVFGPNGSLTWTMPGDHDQRLQLEYGEFCIEPLGGDLRRGGYRLDLCLEKLVTKTETIKKNHFYYSVVFCISILCLATTIFIYWFFRDILLKTEYNKVMVNFAATLLLAFLTLVLQTNLEGEKMTTTTCTLLSLINQFSILAAFSLMTLMSYSISRQIWGFKLHNNKDHRFMRKLGIAYGIPFLITLVTMIVELASPMCSSARPKFGMK